jgi:serine phosphatase RsbU (regulator of sigma subunit)
MNSVVRVLLALFTLHLSLVTVMAQTATNRLDSLQKEMYRLFSKQEVQEFNDVVEQLKAEALRVGDEHAFYKAWANQANYNFTKQRQRGFDMCRDMRLYAQQHNSKYGLYTSSYANAGMLSSLRQYDMAEKEYLECIEFLNSNFPDESKAPVYLSLAKIYQNQNQPKKVRECADIVIADPRTSKLHKLNALSYKCFSFTQLDGSQKEAFNKSYEERKRLQAEIGQEGFFSLILEYEHSLLNGDYDQALEFANAMPPLEKKSAMARIYEKRGMYKEALHWYKRYRDHRDSVNIAEFRRQSTDHTMELNVQRAESEAKDLRLANQELQLQQQEQELRQRQLEAEAAELELKNRDAELANAAMQLEQASLNSEVKELQYRQQLAEMEAQKNAEEARRLSQTYIFIIIGIVVAALSFFTYRRMKQVRKLKAINEELRTAYEQLEQTTTVKNRIENELRIARDIQMTMVPEVFPDRADLDMHAYIQPAKEVGGDLYTFLLVDRPDDEDHSEALLYFCIGDVSGKGVPASLFMAQTTRLFRSMAAQGLMPAEIANRMNRELSEHNDQGMFVTMFIGLTDLHTGHMDFCNCGHNPPVVNGEFLNVESNAPLALWPEMDFVGEEIHDIRGQRLLLYTDGLNEAEDESQNQFGNDHLLELMQQHLGYDAQQTIDMLREAVAEHVGNALPSDDLTMLCIKIKK